MNAEEILTEVYWNLSTLDGDQIKYPDHDTLRKHLKKYMNSRYGIIIAKELGEGMNEESKKHTFIFSEPVYVKEGEVIKEVNMAGILNAQVQEWYKKNVDLLSVIDKLTTRCGKLEEENERMKDENEILKDEFDIKVKVVKEQNDRLESLGRNLYFLKSTITDLNHCIAEKRVRNRELKQKLDEVTGLNNCNDLDKKAIFTSLGVNDTRSALDKIMVMKKTIKHNKEENNQLGKKIEDLQEAYDNCVNECSDHVIEIDSLLQNLEVETVEQGIEKIKVLKDGCLITFNFSAEADLRVENEQLKKKIEDLRKDVRFEFDRRMTELAASTELKETVGKLHQKNEDLCRLLQDERIDRTRVESENTKLKSCIKAGNKQLREMSEEIEKCLAYLGEEKNND